MSAYREQVRKRRQVLERVVDVLKVLGKRGLSYRHMENEVAYTLPCFYGIGVGIIIQGRAKIGSILIVCSGPVWAKIPGSIFLSQSSPVLYTDLKHRLSGGGGREGMCEVQIRAGAPSSLAFSNRQ